MINPLLDAVEQFFADEGWVSERGESTPTLRLRCRGKNGDWLCYASAIHESGRLVFLSVCPVSTPDEHRDEMATLLTMVNFGLAFGNFEMNFNNGETRFKTGLNLGPNVSHDDVPFANLYGRVVGSNLSTFDQYLPALLNVIDGDTALTALAKLEGLPK